MSQSVFSYVNYSVLPPNAHPHCQDTITIEPASYDVPARPHGAPLAQLVGVEAHVARHALEQVAAILAGAAGVVARVLASERGDFACTSSTDGEGLDRCSPVASESATSGAGAPGARFAELRRACAAGGARSEAVSGRYETRTRAVRGA